MRPWYRGFRGSIEAIEDKDGKTTFAIKGIIKMVKETTLLITELPIGSWTEDYKEFLESVSA